MEDLKKLDFKEISHVIENLKEPAYRAKQIYEWIHIKHISDFKEMNNVPSEFKKKLAKEYYISGLKEVIL